MASSAEVSEAPVSDSAPSDARTPDVPREERRLRTVELFGQLSTEATPEGQTQLREQLVLLHVGVARTIAGRYHHRGLEDDDIDQAALIALIGAVRKFTPDRGHDFLTFAIPTICGEIKRHFRDHGSTIRVPRRIQETQREIRRADSHINGWDRCGNARLDELATLLGRARVDESEALRPGTPNTVVSIASDDDWVSFVETRLAVQSLVRQLAARDQRVVFLPYVEEWTQRSIADELGVTQMQVSRILVRIHRMLRADLIAVQKPS
jgi:RNA polymerase sigma-B factor